KIHTGSNAHEMNENVSAKAFTHGQDIYFRNGNYNPSSSEGKELLVHELVHTKQQSEGKIQQKIQRTAVAEKTEKEVVIKAYLYFYGTKATESFAQSATESIQGYWNNVRKGKNKFGVVKINGKKHDVRFELQYEYLKDEDYSINPVTGKEKAFEDIQKRSAEKGNDYLYNFIRIEDKVTSTVGKVSHFEGNQGAFALIGSNKTTWAHEFGHGLGFAHEDVPDVPEVSVTDLSKDANDPNRTYTTKDFRKTNPGIMIPSSDESPKGPLVPEDMQRDPKAKVKQGKGSSVEIPSQSSSLDPNTRIVTQFNIDSLGLAGKLENADKANLGPKIDFHWWGESLIKNSSSGVRAGQAMSFTGSHEGPVNRVMGEILMKENNLRMHNM
ncbi:MAG TPA: DUF4157 domain-containing protein, partial [Bacteroidia bacterium]|nr:DUF4157 domain-containing protein [Bacteroidia bacterium]